MAQHLRVSRDYVVEAMQSPGVRTELERKARTTADRVDQLGKSEGVDMESEVISGTRPKGRPYSRVESDKVDQEWGNRYSERRRIMGRAAEGA